jgi:phospholipid transport system substrate-binding protein
MTRRFFLVAAGLIVGGLMLGMQPVAAAPGPTTVIADLGNEAIKVLGPNVDPQLRVTRFRQLFEEDFNIPAISRFVLGRYWRVATPEQQHEFIRLFTNYIALVYANQLAQYNGERLQVTGSRSAPDGQLVASEIIRSDGHPPARVEWLLSPQGGAYKVNDVIVEGISMAVTQRSEFASVIQRNGGQLQGLIAALRQKTEGAGLH